MAEGREAEQERTMKRVLLIINCIILAIGNCGGPLISRLYFIHGGRRIWLSSCLQTAGFPIMLLLLAISYIRSCRSNNPTANDDTKLKMFSMKPPLFIAIAIIGVFVGFGNYLFAYGIARLPVSTSTLIIAAQLIFTSIFALLLVRQKFTAYSANAVVLLTLGAGVLAMHSNGDRPNGESTKQYVMGFVMTLVAAVLNGFIYPLMELVYKKTKQAITYSLIMEIQLVMCMFATLFCTVGGIINNDFKVIPREARHFELGETKYYIVLVGSVIIWQFFSLGAIGVVFYASALLNGIMISVLLPMIEILSVIFYKEKFRVEKGVSLILSLWGLISYFYGEFKQAKKIERNHMAETELPQS